MLAQVALPGDPAPWEKQWLEKLGIGSSGCNMRLARSDPMFDWRLVAAARVLCASNEKDLEGFDKQQLGSLDTQLRPDVEVGPLFEAVSLYDEGSFRYLMSGLFKYAGK